MMMFGSDGGSPIAANPPVMLPKIFCFTSVKDNHDNDNNDCLLCSLCRYFTCFFFVFFFLSFIHLNTFTSFSFVFEFNVRWFLCFVLTKRNFGNCLETKWLCSISMAKGVEATSNCVRLFLGENFRGSFLTHPPQLVTWRTTKQKWQHHSISTNQQITII